MIMDVHTAETIIKTAERAWIHRRRKAKMEMQLDDRAVYDSVWQSCQCEMLDQSQRLRPETQQVLLTMYFDAVIPARLEDGREVAIRTITEATLKSWKPTMICQN